MFLNYIDEREHICSGKVTLILALRIRAQFDDVIRIIRAEINDDLVGRAGAFISARPLRTPLDELVGRRAPLFLLTRIVSLHCERDGVVPPPLREEGVWVDDRRFASGRDVSRLHEAHQPCFARSGFPRETRRRWFARKDASILGDWSTLDAAQVGQGRLELSIRARERAGA